MRSRRVGVGAGARQVSGGRQFRQRWVRGLGAGAAVAVGSLAIAACGGSSGSSGAVKSTTGLYGALPASGGTPTSGGSLSIGQVQGATPLYIMPITPASDASVYGALFQDQMYPALYASSPTATPSINYPLSLAAKPVVSDGGKTLVINMDKNYTWSNGAPVDANDVIFDIDLIKAAVKESPANFEAYTPGLFPDNLASYSATGKYQVTLKLNKTYNPSFFLDDQLDVVYPLPSTDWNVASNGGPHLDFTNPANATKIYNYLNKASTTLAKWQSTSLWQDVDGPFVLKSFNPTNGDWTLNKNPKYTGADPAHISAVQGVTYTGITPQLNAEKTDALDIGGVDFSQLGQVAELKRDGNSVFGYPDLGWQGAFLNFKDGTDDFGNVIKQLYARQALAHLEDQPAYVTGIFKGAAGQAYGPVPVVPKTPFTPANATSAPYPYSVSAAKQLLVSHGWKVVPNGTSTCQKPGTGAGECGANIPAGTPFEFTWAYLAASTSPSVSLMSEAIASQAAKIGIKINLVSKEFDFMVQSYDDANPASSKYTNDWGVNFFGGYTDDLYPTQNSIFNTGGSYNQGGYSDPTTNKLINASVYSSNPDAVTQENSQETTNLPVLFFPNSDYIYAVNNKVGGPAGAFVALTNFVFYPQLMWIKK